MTSLKLAIGLFLFGSISVGFSYDFESLTTKNGKVYHEIRVLNADEHGLLFRHKSGITKESFAFLSANIQEMYQPVAEISSSEATTDLEPHDPIDPAFSLPTDKGGIEETASEIVDEVVLTVITRRPVVPVYVQEYNPCPTPYEKWYHQTYHMNACKWPSHWGRFHPAHCLTNPYYRERTTRQLLHVSGLLPSSRLDVNHRFQRHPGPQFIRFW